MTDLGNGTPDIEADRFSSHVAFRQSLVELLRKQVFGPVSTDGAEALSETLTVSPLQLYATGVLFPQRLVQNLLETSSDPEGAADPIEGDLSGVELKTGSRAGGQSDQGAASAESEPLNLANEYSPAAAGLSFCLEKPEALVIAVSFGTYDHTKATEPHPRAGQTALDGAPFPATREIPAYVRKHHRGEIGVTVGGMVGSLVPVIVDPAEPDLKLHLTTRLRGGKGIVVSAMLVNHKKTSEKALCSIEDAYFQVSIEVKEKTGSAVFLPIDRDVGSAGDDEELASLELLYRHRRAFALGHGVAGDWNRSEELSVAGCTDRVCTASLPQYELKPILPRERAYTRGQLRLSMGYLFDADGESEADKKILAALFELAGDYSAWIQDAELQSQTFPEKLKAAAAKNLKNCRNCCERIIAGIEVLSKNREAMLAFRLMNRAMLIQQYHSSVLRYRELDTAFPEIPLDYRNLPKERKWRPFQLAFILMNVAGMVEPSHPDRKLVDLIWFPTGGGKTEAYLGLSAFSICMERLLKRGMGVTVLMRYTLRLLTAQQFQRAAALILALETLRQDRTLGQDLGAIPISIGLWVGQSLSPNTRTDARSALEKLRQDKYAQNPFQVLQCPWCGITFTGKILGYQSSRLQSGERTVRFVCPDEACRFGKHSEGLPVLVIDEDIYEIQPTILIGTVDKFAQIAWSENVGRLFGLTSDVGPPVLVIQDELHLISGPLGTMVGLYETAIDRLCSRDGHTHKIVASTATIRRAHQQCWDLYARDAFEFPPQAVKAGESYFAFEDGDSPGRLYVGFLGSAVKSHQTALVRACSPLLQGVCVPLAEDDDYRKKIVDPYGTLVWYFNSLRELGHAATLCMGDIPEFLKGLRHRLNIPFENSRYLREVVELTSRLSADEIPGVLQQLDIQWRMKPSGQPPVDILLATNMIAVGVDVSRLGLIVMSGQPKSTSEYIQATSRVGRQHPGLVLTIYTQTKSRDRSHYERFVGYHQSLYRHVEPTSVTPFSPQARDRGMRGVLIALARQLAGVIDPSTIGRHKKEMQLQTDAIIERIRAIDAGEVEEAEQEIEEWLNFWGRYAPPQYGRMGGAVDDQTLAYPFGSIADPQFQREAWPILTSMRNVDGTCEAQVLNVYEAFDAQPGDQ